MNNNKHIQRINDRQQQRRQLIQQSSKSIFNKKKCDYCLGTGDVPGMGVPHFEKCHKCNGTGYIEVPNV